MANFDKFIKKGEKGAKLKESIRQEKKKARQETKAYFDNKKAETRKRPGDVFVDEKKKPSPAPFRKKEKSSDEPFKKRDKSTDAPFKKPAKPSSEPFKKPAKKTSSEPFDKTPKKDEMPLNKYVAHAGICSRRDAAEFVRAGKVKVNGEVITEPGFKVTSADDIRFQGKKISAAKNLVYILLNKPKDHITTMDDPEGRKTVMDIVKNATTERVYPVGRLDRNTTGVLLLTNDGDLAQKLSHPGYEVKKIYEVTLDKPLTKKDFDQLLSGITLDDGFIAPDSLAYADTRNKAVIGIEIHSGKNRIVRRMFEKVGYDVRNLDRVMYANLTKKNVERGKWRFLQEKEVRLLKYMNASYAKRKAD
jgi:23S rRNA pseudouridine2605 synthase